MKNAKVPALVAALLLINSVVFAQSKIKDGTVSGTGNLPHAAAVAEFESNNKGLLLPRIALTAINAATPLSAMVAGMIVYNTNTAGTAPNQVMPGYYYCDGGKWVRLADAATPADSTNDAWKDDAANAQVMLAYQSNGSTARAAGTEVIIKDDGKVGIGTLIPQKPLEVAGEAKALRLIARGPGNGVANVAIGDSALNATQANGGANVAVGYEALLRNVTGLFNTGIGYKALRTSTGSSNTALGYQALRDAAAGNNNVAIGKDALHSSTGNQNVAIGAGALKNTSGQGGGNIAIGYEAGWDYNSSGTDDRNIFIGTLSGSGIETGKKNTIIGSITNLSPNLSNTVIIGDGGGHRRIYVDSVGNTGIGSSKPLSKLYVPGYVQLGSTDATGDALATAAERAGMIRYSSSAKTLQYHDDSKWNTIASGATDSTNDGWKEDAANAQVKLAYQSNGTATRTAGTEFVIKDDGNVGIGTATPSAKLEVNGNLEIQTVDNLASNNEYKTVVWNPSTKRIETVEDNSSIKKIISNLAAGSSANIGSPLTANSGGAAYEIKIMAANLCGATTYNKFMIAGGGSLGYWRINYIAGISENGPSTGTSSGHGSTVAVANPLSAGCEDGGTATALNYTVQISNTGQLSITNNGNVAKTYVVLIEKVME